MAASVVPSGHAVEVGLDSDLPLAVAAPYFTAFFAGFQVDEHEGLVDVRGAHKARCKGRLAALCR